MALSNNVISKTAYKAIANSYGKLKYRLDDASTYLYTAVDTIVQLDDLDPTLDLLFDFYSTYSVNTNSVKSVGPFLKPVQTLNNHCLTRQAVTDINYYLAAGAFGAELPQKWADLVLAATGQTIESGYINDSFVY